jgi:hypothetical protein
MSYPPPPRKKKRKKSEQVKVFSNAIYHVQVDNKSIYIVGGAKIGRKRTARSATKAARSKTPKHRC